MDKHLRILLAEDSALMKVLATHLLQGLGHSVTAVGTGLAVLKTLEAGCFDLVLMDIEMPEMGGLEAALAIREKERTNGGRIPIIAMSAHTIDGFRECCLNIGMNECLKKPLETAALRAAIGLFS